MEDSKQNTFITIAVIGAVLVVIALVMRYYTTRPAPPSAPGYYEGPMLPKSQRMGPAPSIPIQGGRGGTAPQTGQ